MAWALVAPLGSHAASDAPITLFVLPVPHDAAFQAPSVASNATDEVLSRAGLAFRRETASLSALLDRVAQNPRSCTSLTIEPRARDRGLLWIGPTATMRFKLLARDGLTLTLSDLAAAKGFVIGATRGSIAANLLDGKGLHVDLAYDDVSNWKKLLAGRIDFWLTSDLVVKALGDNAGSRVPRVAYISEPVALGLTCHPNLPTEMIERLADAAQQTRREPEAVKIPGGGSVPSRLRPRASL